MYVELHCHSAYSFLDGASRPDELVLQAQRLGMRALALTDHNGLYGSLEFAHAAKAWGVQPITGAEIDMEGGYRLVLLARNPRGYANLCRLVSYAHLDRPESPQLAWRRLCDHHDGLIALLGGRRGEVSRLLEAGRREEALAVARRYRELFGRENLWIELQQGWVHGDTPRLRELVALARQAELNVVATNDVHYHVRQRQRLQDVLVAIRHRSTLDAVHRMRRPNAEAYLKSPEEMAVLFAELPEALRATVEIAERCADFDLTGDLGYSFPDFHRSGERSDACEALEAVCKEAFEARYPVPGSLRRRAEARLEQELQLVRRHGLCGFFLVYHDLMQLAEGVAREVRGPSPARRAAGLPPGRGRGSSVSSLICYLIGLSHVDPVQNGLSIDRFLNDAMSSVPDIDLDFPRDIRAALIQRVYEHYGYEHAALVSSFATYRIRSAIRDVGKALGLPALDLVKLAKWVSDREEGSLQEAMRRLPEFAERVEAPLWQHFLARVEEIRGLPRHITQHVGGMVISSRPLIECVPIQPARMPGRFVCQWDKDSCEDARMIKIDFLALGMLSLVEECVEQIAASRGETIDLSRIPFDEEAVYDQIAAADTVGVFQIESRAQMQLLPRTQPRNLDELAIEIAIVRPGPIVGGAVNPYVHRRMEQREAQRRGLPYHPPYDHPLLKEALEETLGVILYQDQVLQVAVALAGFTTGQAESLRRSLGRKRTREVVEAWREQFVSGAVRRHVPEAVAEKVFEQILAFSQFGFPKSHAYAFAVLAYQSAWLRHHYPAAYAAALLNCQPMGFYPPHVIVRDMERRGVPILPPDINRSDATCRVERVPSGEPQLAVAAADKGTPQAGWVEGVRIGFNYVKGLSRDEAERILEARKRQGPFRSLDDFLDRVEMPSKRVERLIIAGLFDAWGERRHHLWRLGVMYRLRAVERRTERSRRPGTAGRARALPDRAGEEATGKYTQLVLPLQEAPVPAALPHMERVEKIAADFSGTGLSTDIHILSVLRPRLPEHFRTIAEIGRSQDGVRTDVAGMVVARQRPETAGGILFVLVEDETGMLNVVVRPDLYERKRPLLRGESFLAFSGRVQRRHGTLSLLAEEVCALTEVIDERRVGRIVPESHDFH